MNVLIFLRWNFNEGRMEMTPSQRISSNLALLRLWPFLKVFTLCLSIFSFFTHLCLVWGSQWMLYLLPHSLSGTSGNICSKLGVAGCWLLEAGPGLEQLRWLSSASCVAHSAPGSRKIAQKCSSRVKVGNTKERREIHKVSWGPGSKLEPHHFCLLYGPKASQMGQGNRLLWWGARGLQIHMTGDMDVGRTGEWDPLMPLSSTTGSQKSAHS